MESAVPSQPLDVKPNQLDLAFCCDCTASMGSYIRSAQENIRCIAASIYDRAIQTTSIRYALVKYRDHPPQDSTFVTETFPFTESLPLMQSQVDTMKAQGGGDGPEAVAAALHELTTLQWRPNASKVVVLISDAPPHGLGESGDGFPNGCPLGNDPIKKCKELAALGVIVYAVGVEPSLSSQYKFARDFMMMVASITEGKFLPLGKASVLTDVVVNGALEGVSMKAVWEQLEQQVEEDASKKGETLNVEEKIARTEKVLDEKKGELQMAQVDVSNPYLDGYDDGNYKELERATSLAEAKLKLDSGRNSNVPAQSCAFNWTNQEAKFMPQSVQPQQQQRMFGHAQKHAGVYKY